MFSLPGSRQFQGVVHDMANCLLEERKWLELLQILQSLPQQVMEEQLCLQALHDHVLSSWALSEVKQVRILLMIFGPWAVCIVLQTEWFWT